MKTGLGGNVNAGLKPHAQYVEALRAGATSPLLVDFHELRQEFIPSDSKMKNGLGRDAPKSALQTMSHRAKLCLWISRSLGTLKPLKPSLSVPVSAFWTTCKKPMGAGDGVN